MKKQQQEDRGPGSRPTRIERHLNANAEAERENFGDGAIADDTGDDAEMGGSQATPRGHKGQMAQPHRSGRPSGGNIRTRAKSH
jgi:hypothetical protein